jgi:deoxyadenosine/deoxycytidine kinase
MFDLFQLRIIFIEWIDSIFESIQQCFLSWNDLRVDLEEEESESESQSESSDLEEIEDTLTVCSESELDDLRISDSDSDSEVNHTSCSVWPNTKSIYSEPDYCPRLVSLEGNIGAGKTTLIRNLQEKYGDSSSLGKHILFLPEPVAFWQTFVDSKTKKNILDLFYENPKKYAFTFQMLAFQSRYELLRNTIANIRKEGTPVDTIVMERSLDADYHIFAKTMFENGTLEETEWEIYRFVTRERLAEFGVSGIIWLDVPAEECYHRVQERGREEECGLTLDYLRSCEEAHREWLSADLGFVCRVEDGLHSEEDIAAIETYLF